MDRMTDIFFSMHQGSWAVLVILFVISFISYKGAKGKAGKIFHMITRLFYLIMIVSGVGVLIGIDYPLVYIIKGILALLLIGFMEMSLGKAKRGGNVTISLALVIITLAIVALMGFGVISF